MKLLKENERSTNACDAGTHVRSCASGCSRSNAVLFSQNDRESMSGSIPGPDVAVDSVSGICCNFAKYFSVDLSLN
jgi:hypothetical protein